MREDPAIAAPGAWRQYEDLEEVLAWKRAGINTGKEHGMSAIDTTCETCVRWRHHKQFRTRGNLGECADMVVFLRDGPEHVWTTPDHSCPAWEAVPPGDHVDAGPPGDPLG